MRIVIVVLVLFVGGCPDDGDTLFLGTGQSDLRGDNFPGPSSAANNVNADASALSPANQDVTDTKWVPNAGKPGQGILLTCTEDKFLYAQFFNPITGFSPPVEIFGENQDDDAAPDIQNSQITFLNSVPGRDGDAIGVYRRRSLGLPKDEDEDGTDEDLGNVRLYSFYFDQSQSSMPESTAADASPLIYGFSALATFADEDPSGDDDDTDTDVESSFLLSDGLQFTNKVGGTPGTFDPGIIRGTVDRNAVRTGDDTTFVFSFFTRQAEVGDQTGDTPVGRRLWFNQFDLSSNTTRFSPSNSTLVDTGPVQLDDDEDVDNEFILHNGFLLWSFTGDPSDATDNDRFLLGSQFDSSGALATRLASRRDDDIDDVVRPDFPRAANVFGEDHGLGNVFVLFAGDFGHEEVNGSASDDLFVTRIDDLGAQTEEIDAFRNVTDETPVIRSSIRTALNRAGDRIVVCWLQEHTTPAQAGPGEVPTVSLFALPFDPNATTIDTNSVPVRLNDDVVDDVTETNRDVLWFGFQSELANGRRSPATAIQSNRNRFNLVFTQHDENVTGTPMRVLYSDWVNGGEVNATNPVDVRIDSVDPRWDRPGYTPLSKARGLDDGNGGIFVYFTNQGNNANDATATGGPDDPGTPPVVEEFVRLEIPLSGPGLPSFPVGAEIALSRITNGTIVDSEPGCAFRHLHGLFDSSAGARAIFIDGQGPYLEPNKRQPVCGFGPIITIQSDPGGEGTDVFRAFEQPRLFLFVMPRGKIELSTDGSRTGSPTFFDLRDTKIFTTPTNPDFVNVPQFSGQRHEVLLAENHSNSGPARLKHLSVLKPGGIPLPGANLLTTDTVAPDPVRVDLPTPGDLAKVIVQRQGPNIATYMQIDSRLYYNNRSENGWRDMPARVDDDSDNPVFDFAVLNLDPDIPRIGGTPVVFEKRELLIFVQPTVLHARVHDE